MKRKTGGFEGFWHIYEMETWDEDYFNMEVQAFIRIEPGGLGEFQFGLVSGQIDGEVIKDTAGERFEFTWDGYDELDPMSGGGWFRLKGANKIEGRIKIHLGDSSDFMAERAK